MLSPPSEPPHSVHSGMDVRQDAAEQALEPRLTAHQRSRDLFHLGVRYVVLDQLEKAIETFQSALTTDPSTDPHKLGFQVR